MHRVQILHQIQLSDIKKRDEILFIELIQKIKQSRPGFNPEPLKLESFLHYKELCVYSTMEEYLKRTESLRNNETHS